MEGKAEMTCSRLKLLYGGQWHVSKSYCKRRCLIAANVQVRMTPPAATVTPISSAMEIRLLEAKYRFVLESIDVQGKGRTEKCNAWE